MKNPENAEIAVTRLHPGRYFRRYVRPLSSDHARRQGDISRLAFLVMGGRDPAIAFLNGENDELGGRPLVVATASAKGYARVADVIHSLVGARESA